jgi:hypothetical protein
MEMEVLKKFPDKKTVADAIEFIKELADPILLISGLATFPALYDNCEKCRKFLIDNHIRIRYVIPIQKCADCKHKNSLGTCSFFGAKIFCIWIDDEDCKDVITELFANNKLTSSQCQALTEIPDAKDRLLKAVKLAACPPEKRTDWTRPIRNEKMNSLALSTANFDQRENAVKWGIEKLSSGKTVTEIREMIAGKCQDSVGIVNDAIARMKIISANSLDACLSEQYIVSPNLEFVKANKCEVCRHAGPISCNRHNLIFSTTMLSLSGLNEQSPEAEEISSYFSDSKFEVDIKPPPKKPSLDIELDNLGKDMEVDVGKKSNIGENLDVGTILNDIPELVVDLLPAPQHSDELSVSGLEEQTGFDLTDLL